MMKQGDPKKELWGVIQSNPDTKDLFVDEADFDSLLTADPKGVYSTIESTGMFVDYGDFEGVMGLKKKEPSEPASPVGSGDSRPTSKVDTKKFSQIASRVAQGDESAKEELRMMKMTADAQRRTVKKPQPEKPQPYVESDIVTEPVSGQGPRFLSEEEQMQEGEGMRAGAVQTAQEAVKASESAEPTLRGVAARQAEIADTPTARLAAKKRAEYEAIKPSADSYRGAQFDDIDVDLLGAKEKFIQSKGTGDLNAAAIAEVDYNSALNQIDEKYLNYLAYTRPELASDQESQYRAIRAKLDEGGTGSLTEGEQKFLTEFRNKSVEAYYNVKKAELYELESNHDVKQYFTDAPIIVGQLNKKIEEANAIAESPLTVDSKKKLEALVGEIDMLEQKFKALERNTNVTPEIADKAVGIYNGLEASGSELGNASGKFYDIAEQEMKARVRKAGRQDEGGASAAINSFSEAINTSLASIMKAPKTLFEGEGGREGYGWVDRLYNYADNYQDYATDLMGQPFHPLVWENMSLIDKAPYLLGSGVGSATLFAAGGVIGAGLRIPRAAITAEAFLMSEPMAYEEAIAAGMDVNEAKKASKAMAAVEAIFEGYLVNDMKFFDAPKFRRSVVEQMAEGISRPQAIKNSIIAGTKDVFAAARDEGGEELAIAVAGGVTRGVLNATFGEDFYQEILDPKNIAEQAFTGFMTGGFMRFMAQFQAPRSGVTEDAMLTIAERPEMASKSTEYTDAETQAEAVEMAERLSEKLEGLKGQPGFERLSREKKAHVLSELDRKAKLEESMRVTGVKPESTLAEVAAIEAEVKFILDTGMTASEASLARNKAAAEPEAAPVEVELEPTVAEAQAGSVGVGGDVKGIKGKYVKDGFEIQYERPDYIELFKETDNTRNVGEFETKKIGEKITISLNEDGTIEVLSADYNINGGGLSGQAGQNKFYDLGEYKPVEQSLKETPVTETQIPTDARTPSTDNAAIGEVRLPDSGVEGKREGDAVQPAVDVGADTGDAEALRDVESTAKGLTDLGWEKSKASAIAFSKSEPYQKLNKFLQSKFGEEYNHIESLPIGIETWTESSPEYQNLKDLPIVKAYFSYYKKNKKEQKVPSPSTQNISEAYHAAKKDGSNPELVKAVEDLLVSKESEKIDMTQPRVEDVNISPRKKKAEELRAKAEAIRNATKGTVMIAPKAYAAALDAFATILETVDDIAEALKKWRETDEYKALADADRSEIESEMGADLRDDYVPPAPPKREEGEKPRKKRFRGTIEAFVEDSDLPENIKERMRQDPRSYMETLSGEDARAITLKLIESLGGIESALADVDSASSQIPLQFQSIVYGEALLDAKAKTLAAQTVEEREEWAERENEIHQKMADKATQAGRFNAYIYNLYQESGYAIVHRQKRLNEEQNKVFAPRAKKGAKEVNEILNRPDDAAEAIEEAVRKAVEQTSKEKDKIISDLEKKIAEFRKDAKTTKPKNKPKERRFTADRLAELRKKAQKVSANPFLDPDQWQYLSYAAGYYLESGYLKFADFYKKMSKETKGNYEDYFEELYTQAKARLMEDGYAESDFDSPEVVERLAEEMMNDARAIREELAREKAAKAEAKRFEGKGLEKTIREALMEAGYGKEIDGKMQVDWRAVTGSTKDAAPIVAKVMKALEGKIPPADIARLTPIVEAETERLIKDKKAKAIAAKVKQYEGRRRRGLVSRIKRNTRIQGLIETWKQGGLTEKVILEKLAQDFGIVTFTAEDEAFVQDLVEQIDAAPQGAERERLEERLQAYLEYNGSPMFLPKVFHERMKARLLSGAVTFVKNLSGSLDAMSDVFFSTLASQVDSVKARGLEGMGDKQIFKAAFGAHKKAFVTALDVLLRGGVDMGTAMSEMTGNKEGSPAVRWMENPRSDFENQRIAARALRRNVTRVDRVMMRLMSAVDTFNQVMVQEASSYRYVKAALTEQYPDKSSAEINKMAYDIAFSDKIVEAQEQAASEFKNRGIDIDGLEGRTRFNRRVYEIVEQGREQVAQGVTRRAQLAGNIATYKAPDRGLYSGAGAMVKAAMQGIQDKMQKTLDKAIKAENPSLAKFLEAVNFMVKTTMDVAIPFVGVLGNIMEKGKEMTPYGYLKSSVYAAKMIAKKDGRGQAFEDMSYYAFRATLGMIIVALAYAIGDEDEEEMLKLYGEGSDNIQQRMNLQGSRPENTIVVSGNRVPLDLLGSWGMPLKQEAIRLDGERYDKEDLSVLAQMYSTVNSIWFESPTRIIKGLTSDKDYKREKEMQRLGAEFLTRMTIPATAFARQAGQVVAPKAKTATTFAEQMLKYSGLTGMIGKDAFDYRGKTYDTGKVLTSSADGFVKMFKDELKVDVIDDIVFRNHPGLMGLSRSSANATYVDPETGEVVPMSNTEFYETGLDAAKKFNALLENWYFSSMPIKNPTPFSESKGEKFLREAESELIKAGVVSPSVELVQSKAIDLYNASADTKTEQVKATLSEIQGYAEKAAFKAFYEREGLRVPETIKYADEEYENLLKILMAKANPFGSDYYEIP